MTAIQVMMPDSVKERIADVAHRRHMSVDKVITMAIMRELSKVPDPELERRATRGRRADFDKFMAEIPDVPPDECDRLQ